VDADTKLVPSYQSGKRTLPTATAFMGDLHSRIDGKPQIAFDGWPHWIEATRRTFGHRGADVATTVKEYQKECPADGSDADYPTLALRPPSPLPVKRRTPPQGKPTPAKPPQTAEAWMAKFGTPAAPSETPPSAKAWADKFKARPTGKTSAETWEEKIKRGLGWILD